MSQFSLNVPHLSTDESGVGGTSIQTIVGDMVRVQTNRVTEVRNQDCGSGGPQIRIEVEMDLESVE